MDALYLADTPESLARAAREEPGSAAYHQLFAEHLESMGRDATRERESAALLSPLESRYWIDLGVLAESRGEFPAAERYYLKAASVDRTFAPRWALMNFYFRRHEEASFWRWAREAFPMAYGDVSPVFRLCWLMNGSPESILRLIPPTGYMLNQYLKFLMDSGHWEAARPVALKAAQLASPEDLNLMMDYCAEAMVPGTASAVEVWNELSRRKLEPYSPLDPHTGAIVTNGGFHVSPIERGFDWRPARTDGVSVTLGDAGLNVELSGEQPVAITVLSEFIPVDPGRRYRIDYRYSAETHDSQGGASGLAWEIRNPTGGTPITRSQVLGSSARNAEESFEFAAEGITAALLSLSYERAPGTVRHQEKLTVHAVSSRLP